MSEPLSGTGTAVALGWATAFGLFTNTDFGVVFGAFAGALFVATMPQALSAWRVAAHFLVSFTIGVLGAKALASYLATKTGYIRDMNQGTAEQEPRALRPKGTVAP